MFDRLMTSARAFFKGYVWFQVAITTGDEWGEVEGVMTARYDNRNVFQFLTYSAADQKVCELEEADDYATLSMMGFNLWAWLSRSKYGAWHSFALVSRKPIAVHPFPYVASNHLRS